MPDLIIKPTATSGNKLILKDQAGGAVLTTADSGATLGTISGGTLTSGVTFPAGHVLQVNYGQDASTITTNSSSWTVKHAVSVAITPKFASSKILLFGSLSTYMANAGYAAYSFYKNASDYSETYNLSGKDYGLATTQYHANKWTNHVFMQYLDTATSTTEKTYGITGRSDGGVQAAYIGWGTSQYTTITAMEIKQ